MYMSICGARTLPTLRDEINPRVTLENDESTIVQNPHLQAENSMIQAWKYWF